MIKKLLQLLLLLAFVIAFGMIVLEKERKVVDDTKLEDTNYFADLYITPYCFADDYPVLSTIVEEPNYYSLLRECDWDFNIAQAVMKAESSQDPDAENMADYHRRGNCWGSYGLMQMGCLHIGNFGLTWENIKDPEANIKAACQLWKSGGWGQWGAYTNGSYRKYLN